MSSVEIASSDSTQRVTFYSVLEHVFIKEKSLDWGGSGKIHLYSSVENTIYKSFACGGQRV